MSERRANPRIRIYHPVRLHRPGVPQTVETLTKDLSVGGLRCISATLFPVSTDIQVELVLMNGEEPLTARGQTRWFRMIANSDQFDIGISLLDLSPQNKRRLSAYLDNLAKKSAPAFV